MNRIFKRASAIGMAGILAAGVLAGCADKTTNSTAKYKPISDKDTTMYHVALLASTTDQRSEEVQNGFRDALSDTIGEKHYTLTVSAPSDSATVTALASQIVNAGSSDEENRLLGGSSDSNSSSYDLIAADGESALTASSESTSSMPIVAMDVLSIRDALHLKDASWNDPTGTNVTGISNKIPLADYISLMIESTKDIRAVGLLYSPEDTDAITQNEVLEKYLTEAGIPWKEYELQSTESARTALNSATQSGISNSVITGDKIVAPDSVAGPYSAPDDLGDDSDLQGLNDNSSARTAKQSDNWIGGKNPSANADTADAAAPGTASTASGTTAGSSSSDADANAGAADADVTAHNTAILNTATSECDALLFAPNSYLSDQAEMISNIATAAGVTTVGGDSATGQYTAVSMYLDPYAIGYAAGQQAYRILVGNEKPSEMTLESVSGSSVVKLYNASVCSALNLTLGKSFSEYSAYMSEHPSGSTTERVTADDTNT